MQLQISLENNLNLSWFFLLFRTRIICNWFRFFNMICFSQFMAKKIGLKVLDISVASSCFGIEVTKSVRTVRILEEIRNCYDFTYHLGSHKSTEKVSRLGHHETKNITCKVFLEHDFAYLNRSFPSEQNEDVKAEQYPSF